MIQCPCEGRGPVQCRIFGASRLSLGPCLRRGTKKDIPMHDIEHMLVGVRADTAGFARDVEAMRAELEGPLAAGAGRAGKMIETSLARALAGGRLGFDELKKVALSALAEIGQAS